MRVLGPAEQLGALEVDSLSGGALGGFAALNTVDVLRLPGCQ